MNKDWNKGKEKTRRRKKGTRKEEDKEKLMKERKYEKIWKKGETESLLIISY
jgi:hypothetical protein